MSPPSGTGPFQFRDQFYSIPVPPWLRTDNGERYMYTLELCRDLLCEKAFEAMTIRLPGVGDPSNLPYLAFDRNLQQGPAETNASFAERLTGAFEAWGESGSAEAVLEQLQAYMSNLQPGVPASLPLLTIVSNPTNTSPSYVTWTQLYQGDAQGAPATLTTVSPGNFLWDGLAHTWRRWLILPMALVHVPGLAGSAAATSTAAASACYTSPGQNVNGVWVPATSGTPVNSPWLTITGLSGLTSAQVQQWLTLSGSINPDNNGTFQIVEVLSATSCVIANPAGVASDAGPLAWTVGAYPFIGPGPTWGATGYVFGQGELTTPPIDTGANIGGVWQPSTVVGPTSQPMLSWGLTCSANVIVSIRGIVKLWKSAGTYYPNFVVSFDTNTGVRWIDLGNTSSDGPVVTKAGGMTTWDACAKTAAALPSGAGWMSYRITDTSDIYMVGVATAPGLGAGGTMSYTTLDLAVYIQGGLGPYSVWALGTQVATSAVTPSANDIVRVGVLGGALVAEVSQDNGATWTTLYTGAAPTYPLYGAAAFFSPGASVTGLPYVGPWAINDAGSAYSPNSSEGSGNPDGSFGSVGQNIGGVWVPTRLITSPYDCYCQGTGIAQNCSVENIT